MVAAFSTSKLMRAIIVYIIHSRKSLYFFSSSWSCCVSVCVCFFRCARCCIRSFFSLFLSCFLWILCVRVRDRVRGVYEERAGGRESECMAIQDDTERTIKLLIKTASFIEFICRCSFQLFGWNGRERAHWSALPLIIQWMMCWRGILHEYFSPDIRV